MAVEGAADAAWNLDVSASTKITSGVSALAPSTASRSPSPRFSTGEEKRSRDARSGPADAPQAAPAAARCWRAMTIFCTSLAPS